MEKMPVRIESDEYKVEISNRYVKVIYNFRSGLADFIDNSTREVVIRNAYISVKTSDDGVLSSIEASGTKWTETDIKNGLHGVGKRMTIMYSFLNTPLILIYELEVYEELPYIITRTGLKNEKRESVKISSISPISLYHGYLRLGSEPHNYHIFINTFDKTYAPVRDVFNGYTSKKPVNENGIYFELYPRDATRNNRYDGAIYDTVSNKSLVFGFLTCFKFLSDIEVAYYTSTDNEIEGINKFSLSNICEDSVCDPGKELFSEPLYLNYAENVFKAYETYADLVKALMRGKCLEGTPPSGWCSWHYKFNNITEDDVLRNARFVAAHPEYFHRGAGGMEYIQVDYGWQKYIGTSELDETKFPHGMGWLANEIHKLGLKAGIWFSPFWIEEDSEIFRKCPQCLVHDDKGCLVKHEKFLTGRNTYILDPGHPASIEHIKTQLKEIIIDWGYDMIKADFFFVLIPWVSRPDISKVNWSDKGMTSVERFRAAMIMICDYIKELEREVLFSPCTSPFMPTIGISGLNYICADALNKFIPHNWEDPYGVKMYSQTWAARYYMHQKYWTNNCESLVIREPLPLNEARVAVTAGGLSGGMLFVGDELTLLSAERLKLLSKILPIYGKAATPVDLYEKNFAEIWNLHVETSFEKWNVVGIFNLEDEIRDIQVDFCALGLDKTKTHLCFDFWNKELLGYASGKILIRNIPARDVKLVCIREKLDHPQIISTDMHFTQGGVELYEICWNEKELLLEGAVRFLRQERGEVYIYVPFGYKVIDDRNISTISSNLLVYSLNPEKKDADKQDIFKLKVGFYMI